MINLGGEVGCMISEGPWIFIGVTNFVKVNNITLEFFFFLGVNFIWFASVKVVSI